MFPYHLLWRWLTVFQHPNSYNRREFSYIVRNPSSSEEYCIRNVSYNTPEQFRNDVLMKTPLRIDIGPIYDNDARNNKQAEKKGEAVCREFIIDIDMNDYDDIRTCCTSKSLCEKCWQFLVAAYEVLERLLAKCFGFQHILWVFSGRRGIHAWVCDKKARDLDNKNRRAVTEYLNFTLSNEAVNFLVKPVLLSLRECKPFKWGNKRGFRDPKQVQGLPAAHPERVGGTKTVRKNHEHR